MYPVKTLPVLFFFLLTMDADRARHSDSMVLASGNMITLGEVVVRNKTDIPRFIDRVRNDSGFYKAFRNLHILQFSAFNDIRMNNARGEAKVFLRSSTRQLRRNGCRRMETLEEQSGGDMYSSEHRFKYYTALLYASLFFTIDSVCGEDNIVKGREFSTGGNTGMEKHREQLKMLFFNPGKKIPGIPFLSNKTAIFDEGMATRYDMRIDMCTRNNTNCYVFRQTVKPQYRNDVVVDEMTTWFDDRRLDVLARNYTLSYDAGLFDFHVQMEVQLRRFGEYLVPILIRYNGNWKAIFKKRERGVFTATLFDFH